MANPTCTKASIVSSCYLAPTTISEKQQKAFKIYAKALQLAAIGGTDYIGRLALMLQDANTLACGMQESDREAALVNLAFIQAAAAGAPVPSTINGKMAAVICLLEANDKQLDEADLLLTCKLGIHKSYPQ